MDTQAYTATVTDLANHAPLSDWEWLIGSDVEALLLTSMGDMFVQDKSSEEVKFLDTIRGSARSAGTSMDQWQENLGDPERFDEWFLPDLVDQLRSKGLVLSTDQCYSPIHPIMLGGELSSDNMEVTDWRVHLSIAGQLHRQTKDLPPGTRVSKILVDGEDPDEKPWWKFW